MFHLVRTYILRSMMGFHYPESHPEPPVYCLPQGNPVKLMFQVDKQQLTSKKIDTAMKHKKQPNIAVAPLAFRVGRTIEYTE